MKPWIERGPAADGSGDPCTHALVVGVSRYEFLTEDGSPVPTGARRSGCSR